ncbi:MAG: heavy-metal-associated domain-containing protein [Chitinophagales bacterium]|nr:heavy-metal-associated domain-containing protein [Chitinophagales bacterium]
MKKVVGVITTAVFVLIMQLQAVAAMPGKSETVTIKTSAICGACKKRIEKALLNTTGVEEAILNLNNKKVKVKFNASVTSAAAIRQVIAGTGYDADDVKKNEDAFSKLPECCQRPMEGDMH